MTPSVCCGEPTWAKALFIDTGADTFAIVTIDAIGSESSVREIAYDLIVGMGVNLSDSNFILSGSHSHSGPGAISPNFLWAVAPATDLLIPELQESLALSVAKAVFQASQQLQPVQMGIGSGLLYNVTTNRRAGESPFLKPWDIDPHLGVIRVDALDGTPLATVWNFAIHGTCWGPSNMKTSGDIMGGSCEQIEDIVGGVALFINADAGDIDPTSATCAGMPNYAGAPIIANAVKQVRDGLQTTADMEISSASTIWNFGPTVLNITLARWENCTIGGPLDICTLCKAIHCEVNPRLNTGWIDESPRVTALRFSAFGNNTLMVTIPGEALWDLGNEIRNDTLSMGYSDVFLAGYSNAHMGYFATGQEYDVGGYESELTFWGYNTSQIVRAACDYVAVQLKP
eukprot:m.89246 g.89246  ORF g.89246 m.89246 type:complete len:400 (-) comp51029_c0_seq1:339-1538(-)